MFIVHLGFSSFPKGMASVQRTLLTFKGLKEAGKMPLIINKISHHQYSDNIKLKWFDGIPYLNTAYSVSKPGTFLKRNLNKLSGYFGELILLFKKRKKIEAAILYSTYFLEYPYYFLLSRLFGFKLIIQYVEMFSSFKSRNSFFTKLNDWLIDRYICFFCDGVIVISDLLFQHIKKNDLDKPIIKIPANSDFSIINSIPASKSTPYLMYCGTIGFEEVIEFIISVFAQLKENHKYSGSLLLVISGSNEQCWVRLRSFIENVPYKEDIKIISNIPHLELISRYKGADLLMIPLRDNIQDAARFPHKIGEYTAAQRPFISTNYGEMKNYFTDGVSAILADTYTIEAYYNKLSAILPFKKELDRIGDAGFAIGLRNFDYKAQGIRLKAFIDDLQDAKPI